MAALLEARGIAVSVGGKALVDRVDIDVAAGEIQALLGPNGAGKTTFLKALLGLVPREGTVRVAGDLTTALDPLERARRIAYVPQQSMLTARLTGRDVVAQGRYPHRDLGGHGRAIAEALEATDAKELIDRPFAVCSGGERARLLLARALATEAPLLLLDEPAAALDLSHALHLHGLLRRLADRGKAIVVVQHQLADALRFADRAMVLARGRMVANGPAATVLDADLLRSVFGVRRVDDAVGFELLEERRGT